MILFKDNLKDSFQGERNCVTETVLGKISIECTDICCFAASSFTVGEHDSSGSASNLSLATELNVIAVKHPSPLLDKIMKRLSPLVPRP